ncbi:MAG: hypothetical protein KGK03_04925 [Candidatus Omnitrophica bacterium]|nr:hypothetical protein [Candidatus Omnitrophota bacterium]MDE2222397.1 hypothetical protein [Candidatus Omnitrophota bacterium]
MFWIIILCFGVLVALGVAVYLLPADPAVKTKKKKEKKAAAAAAPAAADTKDWKSAAERWQGQNQALRGEIEKMKMDQRRAQQAADEQKTQVKELTEKLALEKSWREKEQAAMERSKQHEKGLKEQVSRTEGDLEKERSHRSRLERELQELRIKYDQIIDEKRQLSIKAGSQQATLESNAREIRALKDECVQLKERREDVQWVAKSEVDELKKALAAKEQELARLKTTS